MYVKSYTPTVKCTPCRPTLIETAMSPVHLLPVSSDTTQSIMVNMNMYGRVAVCGAITGTAS